MRILNKSEIKKLFENNFGVSMKIKHNHNETYTFINDSFYGKTFAEKCYQYVYGLSSCKTCGNETKFVNFNLGYREYCSGKCVQNSTEVMKKKKETLVEKYGVDNPQKNDEIKRKTRTTNKKLYGHSNPSKNVRVKQKISTQLKKVHEEQNIVEKIKNTKRKKYNNESYNNREKSRKTKMERYGDDNFNNMKKIRQTNFEKYGKEFHFLTESGKNKIRTSKFNSFYDNIILKLLENEPLFTKEEYKGIGKIYRWKCKKCGHIFSANLCDENPKCRKCYPLNESLEENEIGSFLDSLGIKYIKSDRTILLNGKELDFYLPDFGLAIEYNGIYWHSELAGKDRNYHLGKTKECEEKDITLIHIFQNEWRMKRDIWESIIRHKVNRTPEKIQARKCEIRELETKVKDQFLQENHLQGKDKSKIKLGLFYHEELVSVMTFGFSRYNKNIKWELVRFANKKNISVVGGASKLLKYFTTNYSGSVVSYADKRYSNGSLYETLNFEKVCDNRPNYHYFHKKDISLRNRISFQKHKLVKVLENFDENLSEWENMKNNNYNRIWDCGTITYVRNT